MLSDRFNLPRLFLSGLMVCVLFARPSAAQVVELLPNLEPFVASDIKLATGPAGLELLFTTTSWNKGAGPLEIRGGELVGSDRQNVYQYILRSDGTYSEPYLAGTFVYHEGGGHDHIHLEDYARHTLQPVNAPGASNVTGSKISFCLLDNIKVNTRLPNAPKRAVYFSCNPQVQGISVGWGDRYASNLEGQSLPFGSNPSGDYVLKTEIDAPHHLRESSTADNVSCAYLRIDTVALTVQVLGTTCSPPSEPDVTISSITPGSAVAGSTVAVTILGSGFSAGMGVSFENGSGKAPVVSNVSVVGSTQITVNVTIPTGGSMSDPLWDVRVGPVVKPDAFRVIR